MFRRSRFNVRPNVGGAGRTAASSQDAVPASQEAKETTKDVDESVAAASVVTDSKLVDAPGAKTPAVSDGNDPSGDGSGSLAAVQRRKRFSVKPRVAPGRLAALPRTPKSPAKVGSKSPPTNSEPEPQLETQAVPSGAQSPTSPEPEPILVSYDGSGQAAAVSAEHSPKGTNKTEKTLAPLDDGLVKVPYRAADKVALPDKEAAALSEKAKTLLSSKSKKSSIPRFSLSRLLNDPSDIQRMEKAQKLRDMLRQEMRKEKNAKRAKRKHDMEFNLDPSKMTMRDLIRYLPLSNPMSSSVEDGTPENETVVPFSPRREKLPERVQKLESEVVPAAGSQAEEEQEQEQEEEEEAPAAAAAAATAQEDDDEDESLMVPRVKVAEDGTLILDEESLTVEVQRAKGPNPAEDRDPIFERGSTTTYSSFRASTYCKPWTREETDMFFLAISMVGTDFSMIGQLFHNRTRAEIRNKFKKEERQNSWRIDKAFRERRKLDIEYFSKLLEKILEVQANRKKLKSLVVKNAYKKRQRSSKRAKSKEFVDELLDSEEGQEEEEEEEEEDEIDGFLSSDTEDGEKENDNIRKDGKSPVSKARKKRKGQSAENDSAATLKKTKSKAGEEDDACTPEATGAALPQDQPNSEVCESTEMGESSERTSIHPAKLSRGTAAKPVLPLGRKWSKKLPPGSTTAKAEDNASATEDASAASEASKEQMNKATTPPRGVSEEEHADDGSEGALSSGDDDFSAKPPKPTRYGRVPKPRSVLNYPVKEEGPTSKSERKCTSKRNRSTTAPSAAPPSKKSKLITLRASQSESSEDEEEPVQQRDDGVFVPACLRSPSIVIPQVDETMEELDILGNMSTVLDISQDALCPDSLCVGDKSETGVPEACVHQLDLLVDVIDLLSTEHTEVSEAESYNEAAQTLLAIGNMSQLSQSETNPDQRTETDSESVTETNTFLEEEIAEFIKENSCSQIPFASTDHRVTETIEAPTSAASLQRTVSGPDSSPPAHSSPSTSRGSSSKVASRTARSKFQPDVSPVECCNPAPILSQETIPMEGEFDQASKRQTCDFGSAAAEAKFTDAESGQNSVAPSYVAVAEPQTDKSNALLPQGSGDHDAARRDLLECQKPSDSQETRCRLPKVKPKPNLPQISRRARCAPRTAEATSLLSNLESTSKTTAAGAEPQPASSETPSHSASSAPTVTPIMNSSDRLMQSNELTSNEENVESVGHAAGDATSTDADALERGHHTKAAPQPEAKVSKTHLVQEGGESEEPQPACPLSPGASTASNAPSSVNVSSVMILLEEPASGEDKTVGDGLETKSTDAGRTNETAEFTELETEESKNASGDYDKDLLERPKESEVVFARQTRRSRFPKVKPNLLQISRSSLSQSQPTKESSTFSDLESTCKTTAEVKSQPTCSFSIQKPSQSVSSASAVMPVTDLRSTLRPSEQTASREEMGTGLGPAAADTKSPDGNVVESGRDHEAAASQSTSETCPNVPSGARTSSPGGTNREYSEAPNHAREAIQRRRRLPKVKPNLRSPARATQSTSQSTDGPDTPSNVTSDCQSELRCASSEVCCTETSDLSVIESQSSETPAAGEETASSVALHLERVTATGISLNSTTDGPSLNITPPDSFRESSGTTEAKAETPKCTEDTLLPPTSAMKRSRPVKPQPNVVRGARQSRQAAVKTGSATSGPRGQTTVLLTPVEGAKEQVEAASSASTIEAPESDRRIQDDSASVSGAHQTSANLSVLPDTLSVPSDPDEPFFILSLMEVPLDESSHQPPRADLTVQHSSLPAHSAVAGTDRSAPGVLSGEMGVMKSAVTEHPVLPAPPAGSEDTTASAVLSSPQRRPKGFLSFLTRTSSAAQSELSRGKAASRRPSVSKPAPRKRPMAPTAAPQPETTEKKAESDPLASCIMASQPSPRPSGSSTQVSACQHGSGVSVQEQPTNVSQYFLSDIFTEVNET